MNFEEFKELLSSNEQNILLVDTRCDSAFLGYKENDIAGHLKGAIQFDTDWLPYIAPEKLGGFIRDKGIKSDHKIIVYDVSAERCNTVYRVLTEKLAYKDVEIFTDLKKLYKHHPEYFIQFPNYKLLVSCAWLEQLISQGKADTYTNKRFLVFDTYSPVFDQYQNTEQAYEVLYEKEHIPGAGLLSIEKLESGPSLNISSFEKVKSYLMSQGIDINTTVILYSRNPSASFRTAFILKWAGIKDVRILNGGFNVWKASGFPVEEGYVAHEKVKSYGNVSEGNKSMVISEGPEMYKEQQEGRKMVSIRSWNEHVGQIGGYGTVPLLNDFKVGEPKNSIWGFSGSKIRHMEDYYDPDGTLRNPNEIADIWASIGIEPSDKIAFFCGTGWRATLPYMISQVLGWENTVLYDGSWLNWQQYPELPLYTREEVNRLSKPDAKNTYTANEV